MSPGGLFSTGTGAAVATVAGDEEAVPVLEDVGAAGDEDAEGLLGEEVVGEPPQAARTSRAHTSEPVARPRRVVRGIIGDVSCS